MWDENGESIIGHPPCKLGDFGRNARDFVHDDHTGTRAEGVDVTPSPLVLKVKRIKSAEYIVHGLDLPPDS
jgi:hypothetical protein